MGRMHWASVASLALMLVTASVAIASDEPSDVLRERDDTAWQRALMLREKRAAIFSGAERRAARLAERARLARRAKRGEEAARVALAAFRLKRPAGDVDGPLPISSSLQAGIERATSRSTAALPLNVRTNSTSGDAAGAGQSETSIAVLGDHVVVAWNDGQGFNTSGDTQGFAWSNDGGATFVDGGDVLHPPAYPGWRWTSDPVLTVNERTGEFWYCGLADPDFATNAIGVARGRFVGGAFAFDSVFVVRQVAHSAAFLDKQWMTADSASGLLIVTNTTFAASNQIDAYRSSNGGRTWSTATKLSSTTDNGYVQGSRIAVGPVGELHAIWFAADQVTDEDNVRYRRSLDGGATWSAETTPVRYLANTASGAPGFNRERGIAFPSLAVDRSSGVNRGRLHVAWAESFNYWNDLFPSTTSTPSKLEVEGNDATSSATPFTIGHVLRGTLAATNNQHDRDYFSCALSAGEHLYVLADSTRSTSGTTNSAAFTMRLFAPDGTQQLGYSGDTDSASVSSARWIFTSPVSGTYYLRMAAISRRTIAYRIRTRLGVRGSERGRDHRDVFAAWGEGGAWSTPVRIGDDGIGFDSFLPEIAVAADGMPYAWWYDHRDDLFGSRAHAYVTRSQNGGVSWQPSTRFTTSSSNFTASASNISPNIGDYNHLAASATRLHPVWSDARGPDIDVWSAGLPTTTSALAAAADTTLAPSAQATLAWTIRNDSPLFEGDHQFSLSDTRGWLTGGATPITLSSEAQTSFMTQVSVPDSAADGTNTLCLSVTNAAGVLVRRCCATIAVQAPALGVGGSSVGLSLGRPSPNPALGAAWIAYSLPRAGRVRLAVYDLSGARVRDLLSGDQGAGPGRVRWDGRDAHGTLVRAGAYFVRLEAAGEVRVQRLALLR